jgi:hypothetical protein
MSCHVPTISLNHCGMSDVLCERCGVKINLGSEKEIVIRLEKALKIFISDKLYRESFKKSMIDCVNEYSTTALMSKWDFLYDSITQAEEKN